MPPRLVLLLAAAIGGVGVALGAFGAHLLPSFFAGRGLAADTLAARLDVWEIAVRYQMYHACALLAVAALLSRTDRRALRIAAALMVCGVLIFSGCLYAYVLSGVRILGAIVPVGGMCLIAGWGCLAVGVKGVYE
jgi:uncharacterized membrane protein YgdD (TMEM256/DUF423 family)